MRENVARWLMALWPFGELGAMQALIVFLFFALAAFIVIAVLIWIGMRRGKRVSLGGPNGFVFEAKSGGKT
jgi:preprotein translocase subunit SecG